MLRSRFAGLGVEGLPDTVPAPPAANMDVKQARGVGRQLYDQGKLDAAEACVRRVLKILGKKKASRVPHRYPALCTPPPLNPKP